MISGNVGAMRPGDIITAMDGTTIEVMNTDAEGRLTLADAMLYCQDQGVSTVIDVATLTGACVTGRHLRQAASQLCDGRIVGLAVIVVLCQIHVSTDVQVQVDRQRFAYRAHIIGGRSCAPMLRPAYADVQQYKSLASSGPRSRWPLVK